MRTIYINKVILIITTAVFFGMSGCSVEFFGGYNHHASQQFNISSALEADSKVATNVTHIDIKVIGQDTNECSVVADLTVSAKSQEIADAVIEQLDVELVQEADRLMIVVQRPQEHKNDYCVSGKITVTVPSQTVLEMMTTHGDCRFENIARAINIRSTHGDFVFDNIQADITAVSTHGNVNISNTQNTSVDINTTHGGIALNECTVQQVRCSTTHNPIRLNAVTADSFDLRTSHDPIELTACTVRKAVLNTSHGAITGDVTGVEQITARTSHAPIRLRCVNVDKADIIASLNTTHNNIELTPPAGFAGTLSASTSHGSIHSDLPIMVQGMISDDSITGTIGQGTGSIILVSSHGKVTLKSAQ